MINNRQVNKFTLLLPSIGILIFIVLYGYSASLYPGGSYVNRQSEGYNWIHNYWCNLLGKYALNGQKNLSRPFAITSTAILCISIGYFYFLFPRYFDMKHHWKRVIQLMGILSMIFAVFMYTNYHDFMLTMAAIFGFIALIGTIIALRKKNSVRMMWIGSFCLFLIALNNLIYYSEYMIEILPFIQKVTLILFLSWMIGVNFVFIKEN